MSHYTEQLRYVLETMAGYETSPSSYRDVEYVLNNTWSRALGDYPIFDESYREHLNKKILRHFYMQEIGYETEGLFLFELNRKMREIMPYYNQLYLTEKLELDPWENVNYIELYWGSGEYDKSFTHGHNVHTDESKELSGSDSSNGTENQTVGETGSGSSDSNETTSGTGKTTRDRDGSDTTTYGKVEEFGVDRTEQPGEKEVTENDATVNLNGSGTETTGNTGVDERTADGTTSEGHKKQNNNSNLNLFLDTPEGSLSGITNKNYLTDARKITDDLDETFTGDGTSHTVDTIKYGKDIHTETTNTQATTDKGTVTRQMSGMNASGEHGRNVFSGSDKVVHTDDDTENRTDSATKTAHGSTSDTKNTTGDKTTHTSMSKKEDTSGMSDTKHTGTDKDMGTDANQYRKEIYGKQNVDVLDILQKLRDSFLNIDMMVIRELDCLFMQIW